MPRKRWLRATSNSVEVDVDIDKMLSELRLERDQITEAIRALERMVANRAGTRRKRAGWLKKSAEEGARRKSQADSRIRPKRRQR
jgi:hypothetical protein